MQARMSSKELSFWAAAALILVIEWPLLRPVRKMELNVTEPQLLRVKEPEPLRLTLVNLGCLGKWSFLSLNQLL